MHFLICWFSAINWRQCIHIEHDTITQLNIKQTVACRLTKKNYGKSVSHIFVRRFSLFFAWPIHIKHMKRFSQRLMLLRFDEAERKKSNEKRLLLKWRQHRTIELMVQSTSLSCSISYSIEAEAKLSCRRHHTSADRNRISLIDMRRRSLEWPKFKCLTEIIVYRTTEQQTERFNPRFPFGKERIFDSVRIARHKNTRSLNNEEVEKV